MLLPSNRIAFTPGKFEYGLFIWDLTSPKCLKALTKKSFVYCMSYVQQTNSILVSYSDKTVSCYDADYYELIWETTMGLKFPINYFALSDNVLITCESDNGIVMNFIKSANILSGEHIKTNTLSNIVITQMKVFKMKEEKGENEDYLVYSMYNSSPEEKINIFSYDCRNAKLCIKQIRLLKGDYTEISPEYTFYGHTAAITNFIYCKKDNFLISVGVDLYIFIWDFWSKTAKCVIDSSHEDIINSIVGISDDLFATCGRDRKIFVWSINDILSKKEEPQKSFEQHVSEIYDMTYSKEQNEIISGSFDKSIRCFNLKTSVMRKLTGHPSAISAAKIDLTNNRITTAGMDQCLCYWDLKTMNIVKAIEFKQKEKFDDFILLYDDIRTVVKIDNTKVVKMLDEFKGEFYFQIEMKSNARSICNVYNGVHFLIGLSNGEIVQMRYKSNIYKREFFVESIVYHSGTEVLNQKIKTLSCLHIDNHFIASGADDATITIFYPIKSVYKKIISHSTSTRKREAKNFFLLVFTSKEQLISYFIEDTLFIFDMVNEKHLFSASFGRIASTCKLNEKLLAISYTNNNIIDIFDAGSFQKVTQIQTSRVNNKILVYLHDGENFISFNGNQLCSFGMDLVTVE